jgi:hypothetical protein
LSPNLVFLNIAFLTFADSDNYKKHIFSSFSPFKSQKNAWLGLSSEGIQTKKTYFKCPA